MHRQRDKAINERDQALEKREYGLEECFERDELEDRVQGSTDLQISGRANKLADGRHYSITRPSDSPSRPVHRFLPFVSSPFSS
jgi:hypothetical protein